MEVMPRVVTTAEPGRRKKAPRLPACRAPAFVDLGRRHVFHVLQRG